MLRKPFVVIGCVLVGIVFYVVLLSDGFKRGTDPDTVTVWHWMTDRQNTLEELAGRYQQQTGVTIKISLFAPSDVYSKKVTASAQAKILPDIFGVLDTKKTFADFIQYGYVADLTSEFKKDGGQWQNSLIEKALASNTFEVNNTYDVKPGIYGVPLDVTTIQMLYNKRLLKAAGYEVPPETFQEFVEVTQSLRRNGISGMVSGWGEIWMLDCFALNYAFNIMGEEKVMATYRGEVPYTDEDWVKVFDVFRQMVDNHMLIEGVIAKVNKEAEQDFALERAAFAFNGSWSVNVYSEMNADLDYGVMRPPAVNAQRPLNIWGGAGSSFVVNNHSARKDKAIAFLKWLTEKEQQEYLAAQTRNLPSNKEARPSIPRILEDFARGLDHATHPTVWERIEQPVVTERFGKGIQSILLGKKTPEEVAQEVQEVKAHEMAKAAKRNKR